MEMVVCHGCQQIFGYFDFCQRFARRAPNVLHLSKIGAKTIACRNETLVIPLVIDVLGQRFTHVIQINGFRPIRDQRREMSPRMEFPRLMEELLLTALTLVDPISSLKGNSIISLTPAISRRTCL